MSNEQAAADGDEARRIILKTLGEAGDDGMLVAAGMVQRRAAIEDGQTAAVLLAVADEIMDRVRARRILREGGR